MTQSTLTKNQRKNFGSRPIDGYGPGATIAATVRFDDECGNGHNTFAITGVVRVPRRGEVAGGCLHEDIAKAFPSLAPFIKWHLCSTDGPMHYLANTLYHVLEHGPTHAWVYYTAGIGDATKERIIGYEKAGDARKVDGVDGYRVNWDEKTAKTRNLDHARSSAVWPDATDEELTAPDLKERLAERLPALMEEFRAAVESLGFEW